MHSLGTSDALINFFIKRLQVGEGLLDWGYLRGAASAHVRLLSLHTKKLICSSLATDGPMHFAALD